MNRQGALVKQKSLILNAKAAVLAAILAASAGGYAHAADMPVKAMPPAKPVPFFFVNDTSVSFTWFPSATDPGNSGNGRIVGGGTPGLKMTENRYAFSLDHFDVWEYGTNLIHMDYNIYDTADPVQGQPGAQGADEFDGFFRSTFGFNELTHSKMFSNLIFTDVGLELGAFADVETNFLAADTKQYDIGLNFNMNLPGTVLVGILAQKEYAHNNFDACGPGGFGVANNGACVPAAPAFDGDRYFKWAPKLETFISEPLKFLPWPVTFINVANITFPKGTGISQANTNALGGGTNILNEETKTELFEDARLSLDAGKLIWGKPGIWDGYVGYRYWYNKFGTDHNAPLFAQIAPDSSVESSVYLGTTYHFK
jgi:hypothetical protein